MILQIVFTGLSEMKPIMKPIMKPKMKPKRQMKQSFNPNLLTVCKDALDKIELIEFDLV